jgi:signal transduction histidine kinase
VARSEVVPLPTRSGGRREVVWSARGLPEGVAGAVVLVGHDVTELQDAQRLALQTERLATIGRVAAGLAHEGRNALQRIQACLSMLALRARGNPETLDLIDRAQKAQDDLHRLFEDVRSYSVDVQPQRVAADLGAAWREAWADVTTVRGEAKTRLEEDVAGADLTCEFDPFQIKRVFRNLFENSLATGADRVRVAVHCSPRALAVSVRDNGPGFPPEIRPRLFEPFYTTRLRGTGLGLAISRRIIDAHGGRIEAVADGPGAEVRITLPRRAP